MTSSVPQDPAGGSGSDLLTPATEAEQAASESGKSLWIRYGDFIFKHRNLVFPLVMGAIFFAFPPQVGGLDSLLDLLGIALVVAGLGLRAAVVGLAYIKRGGLQKKVYAETLVTNGLFAHCRNPLYVGNLFALAGYFVIVNNPWAYLVGGAYFLLSYFAIVAAEEYFLRREFGEAYAAYCRDVSRWWIDPRGLGETARGMRFNWRRTIIKDYSSVATGVLTVLVLLAYERTVTVGFEAAMPDLVSYGAAAVACLLVTLLVRVLKKKRILVDTQKG